MQNSSMSVRPGQRGFLLAVFCLCLAVQVASLWLSGGFHAEFGAHPDEPSHFITGLMVRDYLAAGAPSGAMRFAENYYVHYPKVALGHYPPLLYIVEAAWMLLFPPWRISLLLLEALLLAASATLLCFSMRREAGALVLVAAPILLILTPVVRYCAGMVMPEVLCLLLVIAAVLWWSRYLESQRWQHAAWFGVFAALAILTKQVALFLALVPPLTVLLTRRFGLLRRMHFWMPVPVVLALSLPWYLYARTLTVKPVSELAGHYLRIPSLSAQVSDLAAAWEFGSESCGRPFEEDPSRAVGRRGRRW
jgi:4-amino-4-deoxy-L-arabinose transferase-like glycosyltransferase